MGLKLYQIAVDAHEPESLARFWCRVLDWRVVFEAPDEIVIAEDPDMWPGLVFLSVPEDKAGKNRLHFDLSPDDQAAEVERLLELGARRIDVGQGEDVTWVVLADPEGNEFCVLSPKTSLAS